MTKYKQNEMLPMPHGGKRENSGRKKLDEATKKPKTVVIRIEEGLIGAVEQLKKGNANAEKKINVSDVKDLIEKAKKEHEERYFRSSGEDKIKNYAMATAITHFDIILDNFIKSNC